MRPKLTSTTSIIWFKHDLRIKDNPAFNAACEVGSVVPIYIYDSTIYGNRELGGASKWWLHHSLSSLNETLNGRLQVFRGDPEVLIPKLMAHFNANKIFWNRSYDPTQISRDMAIKNTLKQHGLLAHSCNGSLLWEPMKVVKKDGTAYRVFTPYYKNGCSSAKAPRFPLKPPNDIEYAEVLRKGCSIDDLNLLPTTNWDAKFPMYWQPGEEGAADNLHTFIEQSVRKYHQCRDIPSVNGTSRLSPHLHFGELSPNQIWYAIKGRFGDSEDKSIETFLSELAWREFSYYLLYHFPTLPVNNFNPRFDKFPWRNDENALKAWQTGKTGIPIVDAGMRELWQTGYMHNRVRMIVASFLVKNLLINWRDGERWFWDCLVDADLASNSASWQWVAGSGADAAPYFRIFNPLLQGEKFDKNGIYVRKYCPELTKLPDKYIHKPWDAPTLITNKADVYLGKNYPKPIVDLKASRQRALDAFKSLKK